MRVSEVMTSNVERLPPDTSLSEAGMKMREHDIGAIPVYEGDRLVGMITDRDIAIRAVAEGKNPGEVTVRQAMSPGIAYCFEDQDIREAGKQMREKKVRRLIVLNRGKRLVGIVSLGDLAAQGDEKVAGKALEAVSQEGRPEERRKPRSETMAGGNPRLPQRRTHASRAPFYEQFHEKALGFMPSWDSYEC